MITTINENDFIQAFKNMGRDENFSHEGLKELFKYYEEYEDSTGEQLKLDVIGICCEWDEYESEYELVNAYDMSIKGGLDEIKEKTLVIEFTGYNPETKRFGTHYLVWAF
tara:strand:- start:507 stop:836 length:330 start_codon:yes stop_codon:yes gene_type:complete